MISLPKSVLLTKNYNYISLSTIEEHQKFCKAFLNSYHSFEKKKTEGKGKNNFKFEGEFFQTVKKQNQEDIIKWFSNLSEEQRIKICTIKNKWLVNLLIQLYLITKTYDDVYFKPFLEMKDLFKDNKNFTHIENDSYNNNLYQNNNIIENKIFIKNLSLYENFFGIDFPRNNYLFNKQEEKKREIEKEFIDQIKIVSLEDENLLDTLILGRDILIDIYKIKKYLNIFSNEKCFQDWLLPIQINDNTYNFVFPHWMHEREYLTIFELIAGYLEQHILLHYEYFYYSKKIYEYSYSNKIVELYKENKSLVSFVNENYSTFGNSDPNKKEFISRMEIREIVRFVKSDEKAKIKIKYIEDIYALLYKSLNENEDMYFNGNNDNILNINFDLNVYQSLYQEMMELGVEKIIEHITFAKFLDIVNCRDIVFLQLRKNILDYRRDKFLEELMKDDFLSSNSGKKKKKNKKKKKKGKNADDNEDLNNNTKKNDEMEKKEEDKKEEKNIEKISDKKDKIKEIKEFKIEDKNKENKNIEININENMNIKSENEGKIKQRNNLEEDLKKIDIEKNFNENSNIKENELSNFSEDKKINYSINEDNKSEENKEINIISEKDISIKKTKYKEKEIFLYPTNTTKKKNKKKKKPCHSAKKSINIKNNNNDSNLNKEKTSNKNSPSINIKNEKSINIFINSSNKSSSKKDNNNNKNKGDNNLNLAKSPTPFLSQNESFSFDKEFDLSDNNDKNINNELSDKDIDNIHNINNINVQQRPKNNNINITNESSSKTIENIKPNNSIENNQNNFYSFSNNNFINYINIPIGSNAYTSYTPSEKFFDSLTSEIKNYNAKTLSNISNLNPIKNKYLKEIENLIKSELESKYEIKYGHYGSHFTELAIEGSDIDILIYYKNKSSENSQDFLKDILFMLNKHEDKFESIQPILTASVPVIKLQISIKNEIKDLKFETTGYSEGYLEFDKINFDLTFTQNEQEYLHSQQVVEYINKSLNTYPMITQMLLLLKRYFKIMKMNKSFHGGLSSYSLYLLIASFCKKFPTIIFSKGKALFSFLGFFSFFEFDKLGIDIENPDIFYSLNNNINNNYNSYNDDNIQIKEINIIDPLTKLNVAKSSFKVDEIQITFRTAYDFLRTEGCYYDYAVFVYKTGYDNDFFKQIKNNFDIFGNNDFKIIKKMFTLNKMSFFCDFFAN